MKPLTRAVGLLLRLTAAAILLQTLFFKFSGAEESVYVFQTLGAEPWGRIASGVAELVTSCLLLVPATAALGGLIGLGVMSGAILSHLTILGVEIMGDGGLLFALALIVWGASAGVLWIHRRTLPFAAAWLRPGMVGGRP
jgi:hypothetical protein